MKITIPLRKIKIDKSGYHLLVKATINEYPVWLVVDTGASQTVLDYHLAEKFSIHPPELIESAVSTGVGGETLKTYVLKVEELLLGKAKSRNNFFVLIELHHVNALYERIGKKPIQGILGGDILNYFNAVIDYKNKKMILEVKAITKSSGRRDKKRSLIKLRRK